MTPDRRQLSRGGPDLLRLDLVVTPRWLREHRRARARAARPDAVASEIADETAARLRPGRELTLAEILRQQNVRPFNWAEFRRGSSGLTSEDWAELRAALAEARGR